MLEVKTVEIDSPNGKQQLTGATVRSVIKALESASHDSIVVFGFEVTNEVRFLADNSEMLMGAVCFIAYGKHTILMLGEEAVNAVRREKAGEQ